MRARTSSGSACSEAAVKPTKSQKSTETTLRSSWTGGADCAVSGAAHSLQNFAPLGFFVPHCGQICMGRVYDRASNLRPELVLGRRAELDLNDLEHAGPAGLVLEHP